MTAIRFDVTVPTTDVTNVGNLPGDGPLRPGGVNVGSLTKNDADLPSTPSKAVKRQAKALTLVRDVWEGNARLHEKGEDYLPKGPAEQPVNYAFRLKRATFENIYTNTIKGLMGFVFREPPKLDEDDVPPKLLTDCENIDNAGTHFDVFARDIGTDAVNAGHAAILVEFPSTPTGQGGEPLDARQESALRPYWVPIKKDDIRSWRSAVRDGKTVLEQIVIQECHMVPDGAFGEKLQERYRLLYNADGVVGYQLLEIQKDKSVRQVEAGLYPTQDEIPIAEIVTSGRVSMFDSDPPFLDLAYLNLAHYRQWSDYDTSLRMTCVPLLFTAGFQMVDADGKEIVISPNTGLNAPDPNAKAEYVTHDGAALNECKQSLEDLRTAMGQLGLSALATQKRAAETAKAKEIDKGASDSALAVTARGLQDGLERALDFHAKYYGLDDGGSVEVNMNFGDLTMDAPTMAAWGQLATALNLPARVVIEALIVGGQLPEDTNVEELEQEIMANAQAEADRKAEEMKMQLAAKQKPGAPPLVA